MASKVKGLVVEIGGDTSGLQNAIKGLSKPIKNLVNEITQINKALKFDTRSPELLAQKHKILQQEVVEVTKKLQELKDAQSKMTAEEIEKNAEKYRKLQTEILTTETYLKQLNYEASNSKKWSDTFANISNSLGKLGSKLSEIGSSLTKNVTIPILGIATAGAKLNADLEKSETSFETFLGSAEEAQELVALIRKDAGKSLFDTSSLLKANQMLISTGESGADARKTINALGNAVLATGGGNDELTRMASNLQQIKNAGKATAMDIRQFAYAGIDVYGILSKYTGKTTQEIKEMDVTYEDLSNALIQASQEGGKYYGATEKMAQTLTGRIQALKVQVQEMLMSLTESLMPILEKIVAKIGQLVNWFNKLSPQTKEMITKVGLFVASIGPALVIIGKIITAGSKVFGVLSKVTGIVGKVTTSMGGLSGVMSALTGPVGIVIAVIGALIGVFVTLWNTNEEFRNKVIELWNGLVSFFQESILPVIQQIGSLIQSVLETIWSVIQTIWDAISPFLVEIFSTIVDWWNTTGKDIMGTIMEVFGFLIDIVKQLWDNVISPIVKFLTEVLKPVVQVVAGVITSVIKGAFDYFSDIWNSVKKIFQGIIDFISGVFTGNWEKAWEGVKNIFKGIVEGLVAIFKAPINFIIDIINGVIDGLNHIKIPDWVPGIGGMGFNISKIPKLAKGGIVSESTLAMIGEGKSSEAVIPLDRTLTKYMAEAIKDAGAGQPIQVNFYPQKMTDAEMERAFNYIDRRFGLAY